MSVFSTDDTKLFVTSIQKLNSAISKKQYTSRMDKLADQRIVFVFDKCHRSQFGETHARIGKFFDNIQLFGFTGTPIFVENAVKNESGKRTTTELFGECLHKYVIIVAPYDEYVAKFTGSFNDLLAGEAKLRSKRELIEKFIIENLPAIADADDIP